MNLAFVNYFEDMIEELGIPISQKWMNQEQILPLSLQTFEINPNLINAPKHCKIWQSSTKTKGISLIRMNKN